MNVKKTAGRMIPAFKVAVKKVSQTLSQPIPKEFPDNTLPVVSDSILSFLARLITPGRSSMFPLMAAPVADSIPPGAASSLEVG